MRGRSSKSFLAGFLSFVFFTITTVTLLANPLNVWQWRNPLPQGNALNDVKYLNGGFMAVGDYGTILTSPNGVQWTLQTSGTTQALFSITFGGGKYVVGGANGIVLTSSNTSNWVSWNSGSTNSLTGIAYGGGVFAAGESAPLPGGFASVFGFLYSSNATDWVRSIPPTNAPVHGMTYGNGLFAAVDGIDGGSVWTSPDGLNWSRPGGGMQLNAVTYGDGYFVAVGADYYGLPGAIISSRDGVNWSNQNSGVMQMLNGVVDVDGDFVVIGANRTFLDSDDTVTWYTDPPLPTSFNLHAITYGNGTIVAVGDSGTIVASTATGWTNRIARNSFTLGGVAYGTNQFVAVGSNGMILGSTDGVVWTNRNSGVPFENLSDVIFNNGLFVAVGNIGLLSSTNGTNWTVSTNGLAASRITFGNNRYVATDGNTFLVSSNGTSWIQWLTGRSSSYSDVAYGNGVFVAVGPGFGVMATSTTGSNWTSISPPNSPYLGSVAFGNGQFVAVDDYGGGIITSPDGINWVSVKYPGASGPFSCVSFGNGTFLAAAGNSLLSSPDGTNWTQWNLGSDAAINAFAYGSGAFVGVGNGGAILQSGDFRSPWLSGTVSSSNTFNLALGGELGRAYRIQTSSDFQNWNDWVTFTNAQYPTYFSDPSPGNHAQLFYRAVSP